MNWIVNLMESIDDIYLHRVSCIRQSVYWINCLEFNKFYLKLFKIVQSNQNSLLQRGSIFNAKIKHFFLIFFVIKQINV